MVAQPIPGLEGLEPDWSQAASAAVDLRTHAQRVAKQRGVPEDVLLGVLGHESGLDPKAYGNGGGVGQFIESTARSYGTTQAELRANPKKAVDLAAQLLKDNAAQFNGDYDKAAAAYFIGPGNIEKASRYGGAGWLAVADNLARQYNQGTVSAYLSSVHGGAGAEAGRGIPATGVVGAQASVRSMLGDTAEAGRPSVSDMLGDAREQRETELQAMTEVAPLPDVTGPSTFGDLAQAPEDVALRSAGTLRSQLPGARDDYLTKNALPALGLGLAGGVGGPLLAGDVAASGAMNAIGLPLLADRGAWAPRSVVEPPPSIKPPSVGDAGLAMLPGAVAPDQDVASEYAQTGRNLGAGFGGVFKPEPPDENPDAIGSFFGRSLSAPSILEPEQGGAQYTEEGAQHVDPSARGKLRGELQAGRRGESQYGAIPEAIGKKPLQIGALAALGFAPMFATTAGAGAGALEGGSAVLGGSGLATLPGAGLVSQLGIGLAGARPWQEALNAVPGYEENVPTPVKFIAENAPFAMFGPASRLAKIGEAVGGGLGVYGGSKIDERLGLPHIPVIGGPAALAGGLAGGIAGHMAPGASRLAYREAGANAAASRRFQENVPDAVFRHERAGANIAAEAAGLEPYQRRSVREAGERVAADWAQRRAANPAAQDLERQLAAMGEVEPTGRAVLGSPAELQPGGGNAAPRDPVLGATPADRRYGAQVRAGVAAATNGNQVDLIETNLRKNGSTWAEFGDAQAAMQPGVPAWQRPPETPTGENPADAVRRVREERAGTDTRSQMAAAMRRAGGRGGGAAGSEVGGGRAVPPDFDSELASVAPITIGGVRGTRTPGLARRGEPGSVASATWDSPDGPAVSHVAYDAEGRAAGVFTGVQSGRNRGLFKITVRPDAQRAGLGTRLLDEANAGGFPVAEFADKNNYTPEGRALVERWLGDTGSRPSGSKLAPQSRLSGEQNPVQPEDIAFGEQATAAQAGMESIPQPSSPGAKSLLGSLDDIETPMLRGWAESIQERLDAARLEGPDHEDFAPHRQAELITDLNHVGNELYRRTNGAEGIAPQGGADVRRAGGRLGGEYGGEVSGGRAKPPAPGEEPYKPQRIDAKRLAAETLESPPEGEPQSPHYPAVPDARGKRTVIINNDPNLLNTPGVTPRSGAAQVVGDLSVGALKTPERMASELTNTLSPAEIRESIAWYRNLPAELKEAFQSPDPVAYVQALMVSQVNTSVQQGIMNVQRAEDILGGARRSKVAGSSKVNQRAIMNALGLNTSDLRGISVKISDFIDSLLDKSARTWAKDDPRAGRPFVVDVWQGRDAGFIDEVMAQYIEAKTGKTLAELGLVKDFVYHDKVSAKTGKVTKEGGTFAPNEKQYEAVSRWGNEVTQYFNDNKVAGKSDWTPSDVQAVSWTKIRKIMEATSSTTVQESLAANTRSISIPGLSRQLDLRGVELSPKDLAAVTTRYVDNVAKGVEKVIPQARWQPSPNTGLEGARYKLFSSPETATEIAHALSHATEGPVYVYRRTGPSGKASHVDILPQDGSSWTVDEIQKVTEATAGLSRGVDYAEDGKSLRIFGIPNGKRGQARLQAALEAVDVDRDVDFAFDKGELTAVGEGGEHADALERLRATRRDAAGALDDIDTLRAGWLDAALEPGDWSNTRAGGAAPGTGGTDAAALRRAGARAGGAAGSEVGGGRALPRAEDAEPVQLNAQGRVPWADVPKLREGAPDPRVDYSKLKKVASLRPSTEESAVGGARSNFGWMSPDGQLWEIQGAKNQHWDSLEGYRGRAADENQGVVDKMLDDGWARVVRLPSGNLAVQVENRNQILDTVQKAAAGAPAARTHLILDHGNEHWTGSVREFLTNPPEWAQPLTDGAALRRAGGRAGGEYGGEVGGGKAVPPSGDDDTLNTMRAAARVNREEVERAAKLEAAARAKAQAGGLTAPTPRGGPRKGPTVPVTQPPVPGRSVNRAEAAARSRAATQGAVRGIEGADQAARDAAMETARGYHTGGFGSEVVGLAGLPRVLSLSSDWGTARDLGLFTGSPEALRAAAHGAKGAARTALSDQAAHAAVEEAKTGSRWFEFASTPSNLPGGRKFREYQFGQDVPAAERVPEMSGLNTSAVSRTVERFHPGVSMSDRVMAVQRNLAGIHLLDKRMDELATKYGVSGPQDALQNPRFLSEAQSTIDSINHLRGYSGGGKAQALSFLNFFTSPQQMISRLQVIGDPLSFAMRGDVESMKFAARNLAGFGSSQAALMAVMRLTGASVGGRGAWSVNLNPTDSDFGTIRVGNTRYDTLAGLGPTLRLVAKIGAEASDQTFGTDYAKNQADIGLLVQRWLENKEQPTSRLVTDFMLHNKLPDEQTAIDMMAPSIATGFMEAMKEERGGLPERAARATGGAALNFAGIGANTYKLPRDRANDIAGELYDGKAYNDLELGQQLTVLDKLPAEAQRGQGNPVDLAKERYQADLAASGYQELEKAPEGKRLTLSEQEALDKRNRPVREKNAEIIAQSPELELQRWFFGSKQGGTLENPKSVSAALALDLPERKVQFAGHDRNLAATQDDKKFWATYGETLDMIENGAAANPANRNAFAQYKYKKSFAQLDDKQKDDVLSDIRSGAKQEPWVEALMIFSGREKPDKNGLYTASSAAVASELDKLWKAYPKAYYLPKRETTDGKETTVGVKR